MKAAFFDGLGQMQVMDHPDPIPQSGEAIVQVKATGICGSDLLLNNDKTAPDDIPAGHEVAGEIVDIGSNVDFAYIGKRVAVETIGHGRACEQCWYCRFGQYRQCMNLRPSEGGGFAQYIKRKASGCYEVADKTTWGEAALVEPLAVSIHAMRRGDLKGGESVVILGAGNIGLTAVAAARKLGAGQIFVTARHKQQSDMALALGADVVVEPHGSQLRGVVENATEGRGADLTIETVGGNRNDTLVQAVDVTRMQGRIVILGGFRKPLEFDWLTPLLKEQAFLFSSCYGVLNGKHDYEIAIEMLSSQHSNLSSMITHIYPLSEIQKGFESAYDKSSGSIKVQIHQ